MSDNTRWHAPGASVPPPQAPAGAAPAAVPPTSPAPASPAPASPAPAAYGPPPVAPPAYGPPPLQPPGYGAPPAFGAPPGVGGQSTQRPPTKAWAAPPKPGLIPLRPLSFSTILGAPYQALRRNPRPTFGMSLVVQGFTVVLTLVVVGIATYLGFSRFDSAATSADEDAIIAGTVAAALAAALIPIAFSLVASGVMQAIIVLEVARQTLGEKLKFARLWSRAKGRLWAVAGFTVLLAIALLLAVGVVVGIVAIFIAIGDAAIGIGVILAVLVTLALVVVAIWIGTKIAFVPSIMVLERATMGAAIRRSWSLTNGRFWYTCCTLLLVAAIINLAASLVSAPLQVATTIATPLLSPTGDTTTVIVVIIAFYIITIIATLVVAAVTLVVQSATTVLLYIDARMRKEGLDLDLVRFVEARQSGDASIPDPFLVA